MTALLEARGVRVRAGGITILDGGDLTLEPGRLVAIVGPNGAGKSTFVRAIAGLQSFCAGSVRWQGREKLRGRELARLRAFVPQRASVPEGVTVRQAVTLGRAPHLKPLARLTRADHSAVDEAITRARVELFADRHLTTLSGGELQRVQIAVGLAQQTPVLLADEPTSHLDLGATASLVRMLRSLTEDGLAVLLVVHDLALAAAVADEVVVMSNGKTVATGPAEEVLHSGRIAEVWGVDAELHPDGALRVGWL